MQANPVQLRVYKHGIWIRLEKVFIPYERLVKIETAHETYKHMNFHYIHFHALDEKDKITQFTVVNSGLSLPYGEVLDGIYEQAAVFNQERKLPPPVLLIEGFELSEEEFKEFKSR